METQDNGISLGQLASVFKKSLVRGIIYVLISVLIATAVLVTLRAFTTTKVYESTVSFQTAKKTALSSMNAYKAQFVNAALTTDGKSLSLSENVVKNLTVTAVIPAESQKDASFIPTNFTVSLKQSSDLKLSSGEYKSIVDNVAKSYVNQFAASSMPSLSKSINVNSQVENRAEYLQVAFYLSDVIDDYLFNLNSFATQNPAAAKFSSTASGKTVSGVIADLNFIKSTVDNLKLSIILNNYGLGNLKGYLESEQISATAETAKYEKIYNAAVAALNAYKSSVETITKDANGNNIYQFDDSAFAILSENVLTTAEQYGAASKKQSEIDYLVNKVADGEETDNEEIANELKSLGTELSTAISDYNSLSSEFNGNKTAISQATVSKPAHGVAESIFSIKIILALDVALAIIAYFVAFATTYVRIKKSESITF